MPIAPRHLTELLAAVGAESIDDRADDMTTTWTGVMAGAGSPSRAGDDGLVRGGLMTLAVGRGHCVRWLEGDDFDRGRDSRRADYL
jgi:hypothetical protein